MLSEMGHHGADDCVATASTNRLVESDPDHGPVVFATKRPHPKIGLHLCEVLPARLAAFRIVSEGLGIDPELVGDKRQQVRGWDFVRSEHPAGKSQVGKMHRKPEAVCIAAPLPDQGHIFN
jgi:hypothetical protein